MSNLLDQIALAESGGNINAKSPTPLSSAQGLFGFTDAAFNQVKQDNPDLAHITKDAWAADPKLQRTFAERLQQRHERVLKGQGLDVNPVSLYANWHFGEGGGPKFLKSAPSTPIEDILDPMAIAANPHLQGKTQAQVMELLGKKMGVALPNALSQTRGNAMDGQTNDAMAIYQSLMAQQGVQPQFTPEQLQMLTQGRKQRAAMLPLAIGASLAGDKRISGLGEQMYREATEAQGNMQLGNEGWLTPDGQMIANPFTAADRNENRQHRALNLALQMSKGQQAPAGYSWITGANGQRALQPIPGGPNDPNVKNSNLPAPTGYRWADGEGGQRTLQVIPGGPEDPNVKGANMPAPSGYQWVADTQGGRKLQPIAGGPNDPNVKDANAPAPAGYQWVSGANGERTLTPILGGPSDPVVKREGSEPTEDEKKASGYALRIQNGLNILKSLTDSDPGVAKPELLPQALSRLPFVGEQVANAATSSKRQQVEAAQLDMLDAALTLNTGAAYTKEQLQGLSKSYFPATGDSAETIRGKQERLDSLIATARLRAGRMDEKSQKLVVTPQGGQTQPNAQQERKSINGKNYVRRGGQWYEE